MVDIDRDIEGEEEPNPKMDTEEKGTTNCFDTEGAIVVETVNEE